MTSPESHDDWVPLPAPPDPAAPWDSLTPDQKADVVADCLDRAGAEIEPEDAQLYALYPWEYRLLQKTLARLAVTSAVDLARAQDARRLTHGEERPADRGAASSFLAGVLDWEQGFAPEPFVEPEDGYGAGFPKSGPTDDAY